VRRIREEQQTVAPEAFAGEPRRGAPAEVEAALA
jgi:hypothetical protein